ncbi:hypothetical protein UFOVP98_7 [uncultured Caudovirales phage]|uniref:Uncharacterized protein n=1 Tax=uncultured Caudovirales phage TaxID=2100421 RepID=A0A6J5KZ03_9CAUD|nr:hypothetical protein UFOVP98_7 [uncultured Caudovirales phage]CAB4134448.1 hypothetical protein UFOVP269_63 [uncultured Caudovirales phage]
MFGEDNIALTSDLAPPPSMGKTFFQSLEQPALQVKQLYDYVWPGKSSEQSRRETAEHLENINESLSDPRQGGFQQVSNSIGGMIGSILPTLPFGLVGGAALRAGAGVVGFGAETIASAALAEEGSTGLFSAYLATQVPLHQLAKGAASHWLPEVSIAGIATPAAEAYGFYKGMVIPEHFAANYNAIENSLDKNHAIEDWGSDNYGFLLGAAPLAAGYVAFKGIRGVIKYRNAMADSKALDSELTRLLHAHEAILKENKVAEGIHSEKVAKVSELQEHLQHAEDLGYITPEQHEWYLDYLENPNHPDTHAGAMKALTSLQIPYDRVTGKVWNEVLSPESIKNLQAGLFDQAITNFSDEERQLLSSYITHNALDGYVSNMRENPNLLTAIQGMTHGIGLKIEAQSAALRDLDYALSKHLEKGVMKNHIFSQKDIYNHLRKIKAYHPVNVPYEVPYAVRRKLALERKLNILIGKKGKKYRTSIQEKTIVELKKQIKEFKLPSPEQELAYLKDVLMPEGKLLDNFKSKRAYHRLEELSQVWGSARVFLDRIHGEAINVKQKGLNEILKRFTEMVDANIARLADPDSVKRYLHSRLEKSVPIVREFERSGINLAERVEAGKVIEKPVIKPDLITSPEIEAQVQSSKLEFAKQEFDLANRKFKQFSESAKALEELIACDLGE